MSLSPHKEDENRDDVLSHIKKLKKEGTAQASEQLKTEFNMDVGGKDKIQKP
ncbi:hypothetical protein KAR91_47750 [Candidatus Pacearchaeota archaeon]|nr:hypothetical protein [Candidatus Pacearchaeota archaeon]